MRFLTKRWLQIVILLSLLLASVVVEVDTDPKSPWARVLNRVRHVTFDFYNDRSPRAIEDMTAIVDIDEPSLSRYGQWPWPRTRMAQMVTTLKAMGAKSIAFDMVFAESDRTSPKQVIKNLPETPEMAGVADTLRKLPDNDDIFAKAIADAGNVVLGFVGATQETEFTPPSMASVSYRPNIRKNLLAIKHFATNLPKLSDAAAGDGAFVMTPDEDGVVRRVPLVVQPVLADDSIPQRQDPLPGLALEALRVGLHVTNVRILDRGKPDFKVDAVRLTYPGEGGKETNLDIPTEDDGRFLVHYARHQDQAGKVYVSAWEVLEGKADPAKIKDKIVFIGTSAIGLLDLRSSPLDTILPGVEIHAEIVNQALHGDFLKRTSNEAGTEGAFTLFASLLIIALAPFISVGLLAFIALSSIAAWAAWGFHAYKVAGTQLDIVFPACVVLTIFTLSSILSNLRTELEKRMIRQAFGHYISPVLIEELTKDPDKLKLGGDVRELTVMFTDIRNFTTISESMDPAELIRMMNDFLTPMTSAVLDNRGTIDKYMGDAMMTFWNAPVDDPFHAQNACKAALEMVEALKPVNAELKLRAEKAKRPFHELRAGIGINSGRASVGNMGSRQRFAYSALGDTVNLASRMEGQTKAYGVTTMISSTTQAQVPEFATIELDLLTVKGRTEPERVYALMGDEKAATSKEFMDFRALHNSLLDAYRKQAWETALYLGRQCASARPELAALYQLYADRIAAFMKSPPGTDWAGVWVAKEK